MTIGRVLVTGAAGQLGSAIVRAFGEAQVVAHTRESLDVTDGDAVARAVAAVSPSLIVNCTAYNDVDGAEAAPLTALAVNAFSVRSLARAAADAGAVLVHYSTDFVFDGHAREPYDEQARPSPQSVYAASKLLGEWFALELPRAYVLRVETGAEVRVFTDRVVSPSYTEDVAAATRHLVTHQSPAGLYHCVNSGHATWHDVALEVARLLGCTPRLVPMTMGQVAMKAKRPLYCALSNARLKEAGYAMPSWQDALQRWLAARQVSAA